MYLAAMFLLFAATLIVAWRGSRRWALRLFFVALALTVAVYFHHATDVLPLSF